MDRIRFQVALTALTGIVAGTTLTAAAFEGIAFTEFASVLVISEFVVGAVTLIATAALVVDARTGSLAAMLGGALTILLGVIEIAAVGLVWSLPMSTQPAWLHELFDIVAGAVIIAAAVRVWHPREAQARPLTSPAS